MRSRHLNGIFIAAEKTIELSVKIIQENIAAVCRIFVVGKGQDFAPFELKAVVVITEKILHLVGGILVAVKALVRNLKCDVTLLSSREKILRALKVLDVVGGCVLDETRRVKKLGG